MNLLDRLKQAEAAATPGPWEPNDFPSDPLGSDHAQIMADSGDYLVARLDDGANRDLIVLLRNHAADLIRLVEAARTASDHWHDATVNEITIGTDMAILKQLVAHFLAEEDA